MLGFIIFGWPTKEKVTGTVSPGHCEHCNNRAAFQLTKSRKWLTLYWIPVLPLERANYHMYCEICRMGFELEGDEIQAAKDMTEMTEEYAEGEMGDSEYERAVAEFRDTLKDEHAEEPEPELSERDLAA